MAILARIKNAKSLSDFFSKFKKKSSVKLLSYLNIDTVTFLSSKTRNDTIEELIELLFKAKKIKDKKIFYKKILEREKIVSTGIGMGIAIPHAKSNNFEDFFIALGIQKKCKINWQSIDKSPVRIVFMIGGPENKQSEYLQILSRLTTAIKNESVRNNLLKASSKEELINIFSQF